MKSRHPWAQSRKINLTAELLALRMLLRGGPKLKQP